LLDTLDLLCDSCNIVEVVQVVVQEYRGVICVFRGCHACS
jgi:hypothetical protein